MSDHPIVAFIEARYAERAAMAKAASECVLRLGGTPGTPWRHAEIAVESLRAWGIGTDSDYGYTIAQVLSTYSEDAAPFVVQNDPAYVLADIASKRAILLEHADVNDGDCGTCIVAEWGYPTHGGSTIARHPCKTVRLLAAPFASHPDYLAEWSV